MKIHVKLDVNIHVNSREFQKISKFNHDIIELFDGIRWKVIKIYILHQIIPISTLTLIHHLLLLSNTDISRLQYLYGFPRDHFCRFSEKNSLLTETKRKVECEIKFV